jgi:hypothetical protein
MGYEIAVFLEHYDAVYVEIPKVACTSLKVALAPLVGADSDEAFDDHKLGLRLYVSEPAVRE